MHPALDACTNDDDVDVRQPCLGCLYARFHGADAAAPAPDDQPGRETDDDHQCGSFDDVPC